MGSRLVFLFCFLAAISVICCDIEAADDQPSLRIAISATATFKCCFKTNNTDLIATWQKIKIHDHNNTETEIINSTCKMKKENNLQCCTLEVKHVTFNDTGLYQCETPYGSAHSYTHGTFLQVYEPIEKILNISEQAKNSIITAQGVLLLIIVIIPGAMLLCKSKGLHELERSKSKEEENIYEGLNLDDYTSTYHQIQRSLVQGPYQDVMNKAEDDIQLEKP
ncbi:B-cell antigen receptor complex-associated protein alpha chain isoform X2 [Hoplias malabaricus]|uniref:B-cell antigen receptor complex-associated protein alpha chain isoform X2 n=1 Tax=Hoplias malabaricus TaxID=27720 RepID=UPI00346335DE